MSEKTLLPVGTILPYACGDMRLLDDNWLPCDGAAYDQNDHPELHAAIGTGYGSPGAQKFNVPDLRGLFVRACDNGSGRDSRVATRTALLPGGNAGDAVGSYQVYGTAPAHNPFSGTFPKCNLSSSTDDQGCQTRPGAWNENMTTVSPSTGGDLESRPPNIYVNWIIKARSKNVDGSGYAMVPVAAAVAYAGNDPKKVDAATWLFCDGSQISVRGLYKALAIALSKAYGSPDADSMCLPDFRGRFLRGVDLNQRRDPDADKRTAPYPQAGKQGAAPAAFPGNTGDAVGSMQPTATALPQTPFTSALYHLPTGDSNKRVAGFGPAAWEELAAGWDSSTNVNVSAGGGDTETRPRNMAVDWFVAKAQPDSSDPDDLVPVGAVVAVGRQALAGENFLLCNGQSLSKDKYNELYAQIGNLYGADKSGKLFNVPNYQGVFLRAADHGAKVDLDAAARVFSPSATPPPAVGTAGSYQDYATKTPSKPFIATVTHMPTSSLLAWGSESPYQNRINGDLTTATCTGGGDGDTAPANIYVQYFIKTRS